MFDFTQSYQLFEPQFPFGLFGVAVLAIILHVANYNATAHLEYNTRIFTKIFGGIAIYLYAVYLVVSALIRDDFIQKALIKDANTLYFIPETIGLGVGGFLFVFGILLNLWTLKELGIKGMYNGDSFGYLFDAPVTGGPYQYFNDPQYVGTTLALFGSALYYRSQVGLVLTVVLGITFYVSVVFVEGPHMARIYSQKNKEKKSK